MELIGLVCTVVTVLTPLVLALFVGSWIERRHLYALDQREALLGSMLVTDLRTYPQHAPGTPPPQIVVGEVVIACDYFKAFLASWKLLFGGRVGSYQRVVDRARREAALRVLEQARALGYNAVCNLRIESADVGGNTQQSRMPISAVIAFGTAYVARQEAVPDGWGQSHADLLSRS